MASGGDDIYAPTDVGSETLYVRVRAHRHVIRLKPSPESDLLGCLINRPDDRGPADSNRYQR